MTAGPRRRWWVLIAAGALLVVGLITGPMLYAAVRGDAPGPASVQAQPEGAELSTRTDGTWRVAEGSSVGYRVDEVLNGTDVTVVGSSDQVTGSVLVADGVLMAADLTVQVADITTDSERRDRYFRDDVMDVDRYPVASFVVSEPVQLPELAGTPVTVPVNGELTLAGTTRQVQVDLSVVRTPDGVDASGSIPVTFSDYGIEAPDLGFVRVEPNGAVEIFLRLAG